MLIIVSLLFLLIVYINIEIPKLLFFIYILLALKMLVDVSNYLLFLVYSSFKDQIFKLLLKAGDILRLLNEFIIIVNLVIKQLNLVKIVCEGLAQFLILNYFL